MGIFSLMKTSAKIGEDIVGVFSFTEGTVPCVQVNRAYVEHVDFLKSVFRPVV